MKINVKKLIAALLAVSILTACMATSAFAKSSDSGSNNLVLKRCLNRVVSPYNVIKNNTDIIDTLGHGTEIITVACSDNDFGVYGIAPKAKIMPIVVTDKNGNISPKNLALGIKWAILHNANVINLSMGSHVYSKKVADAILLATKKNIIVVASSGDYSEKDLLFPSNMSNVIAVASQDKNGNISNFSSYSKSKCILIPGESIESVSINDKSKMVKGSSVSCALMSGIIALALEVSPHASVDNLVMAIKEAKKDTKSRFIDVTKFLKYIK